MQSQPSNFDFRQFRGRGRGYSRGEYHRPYRPRIRVTRPTIQVNEDFNSVEIRFPSKPSDAIRARMGKGTPEAPGFGWKWNKIDCCWYKRNVRFIDGNETDISAQVMAEATELVNAFLSEMNDTARSAVEEGVMCS